MPRSEVIGVEETQKNMAKLAKKYSDAVVKAAIASGQIVRSEAIKSIQDGSSGEIVTRYTANGNGYDHTTSKEGEAPNTDTGRLVESIQVDVSAKGVFVGSTLEYAGWLEYGTVMMNARPWLIPATEKSRAEIERLMGKRVKRITDMHGRNL